MTERAGGETRNTSIAFGFQGTREIVAGLTEAADRCFAEWIDSLREESPTDEAIAAAVYAQLGRPPDPLWDPDALQLLTDWEDSLVDPELERLPDPAQLVAEDEVLTTPAGGQERLFVVTERTDVVTPARLERAGASEEPDEVTVVNGGSRDVVVVDEETHEAVAVIPAQEELLLRRVDRSP